MAKKKSGRKKGGHNRGFFYQKSRGWYVVDGSRQVPLRYEDGTPIRASDADETELRNAYARWRLEKQQQARRPGRQLGDGVTVLDVCLRYLAHAKTYAAPKTHADRADTLFDFCFGLPPEQRNKVGSDPFRDHGVKPPQEPSDRQKKELAKLKIHEGLGRMPVSELKKHQLTAWLQTHPTWAASGERTRIQAVKRAINFAVEEQCIAANPIRGYRTLQPKPRVTYITPQQEQILRDNATQELATAIQMCIRTGARPGKEFSRLTRKHVTDYEDRMEWRFAADESKTKKLRIIRLTDPEIIRLVRERIGQH